MAICIEAATGALHVLEHPNHTGVVTKVFTDLAVIDVTKEGFRVREILDGLSLDELRDRTGAPLTAATDLKTLAPPI